MSPRKSRDLTTPDLVVLSLLCERPMHGYELVTELEMREVKDWAGISRPQVYYSLEKLLKAGLLKPMADRADAAGPERKVYGPTLAARGALADALSREQWAQQRPAPPFLTWAALSMHAKPETIAKMLTARRAFLTAQLEKERATLKALRVDRGPMVRIAIAMVELTVRQFQTEVKWLDESAHAFETTNAKR